MRIEARDICFRYHPDRPFVLNKLNFTIEEGEKVALVGPSGYGKSTLAKVVAGYLTPQKGEVLYDGRQIVEKGISSVQLIHQHPEKAINPRWKIKKVLEESGMEKSPLLGKVGIQKEWLDRYPRELSGGELQRFCVMRALCKETKILIADEMSTMLDVITQAQIWHLVLEETEKRKMGLLVVTHNKALAKRLCSCIVDLTKL